MISLKHRLLLAWKVLRMEQFEIKVEPMHVIDDRLHSDSCDRKWRGDNPGCSKTGSHCVSTTVAKFELRREDHWHVCAEHAKELLKKK